MNRMIPPYKITDEIGITAILDSKKFLGRTLGRKFDLFCFFKKNEQKN